jgi:hypothetical protein
VHVVTGAYEVDYLGHYPDQAIADQVFFHDIFAFGVSSCACITGSDKPSIIKQQTGLGPKDRVIRIKPCVAFIDDY